MDKNYFIDEYLQGKRPIDKERWELPTEGELDRDEALFDALLAEREKTPLHTGRGWGWVYAAAAVLVAVFALFTWKSHTSEPLPTSTEMTAEAPVQQSQPDPQEDTAQGPEKIPVLRSATKHASMANEAHLIAQRSTPNLATAHKTSAGTVLPKDTLVLSNAADSLYYYLTQLEDQMGDCRDSACFAQLGELMRADERIKTLVQKIIHKQVETAYQEEYLVDTTTRYVPL